jgi:hypothetical protein
VPELFRSEVLRDLRRSGFRLRAQTPARRLKFDPDQVRQILSATEVSLHFAPLCLPTQGPTQDLLNGRRRELDRLRGISPRQRTCNRREFMNLALFAARKDEQANLTLPAGRGYCAGDDESGEGTQYPGKRASCSGSSNDFPTKDTGAGKTYRMDMIWRWMARIPTLFA